MIYELRTYTLMPGAQPRYLKLNAEIGRKIRGDSYGTFEGGWTTEFGTLNQYVHLWSYPSHEERDRLRGALARNDAWAKEYIPQIRQLMLAQENKILAPVVPLKPPTTSGNLYELRWYRTLPGRTGEWLALFKDVLPAREKLSKNVGLWQTEMGQLNEVVHLWVYADLNARAAARAAALADPEWQAYLGKSIPLLLEQKAVVLVPTPVSPMR